MAESLHDFSAPGFARLTRIAALVLCVSGLSHAEQTVGLFLNDEASSEGYTLFSPPSSQGTYLIDNEGHLVHSWWSPNAIFGAAYLFENGDLLRGGFDSVEKLAWDGTLLWQGVYTDDEHMLHHDVEPMPNGNVLMITWEVKTELEAIEAGKNPAEVGPEFWPLRVIEVEPIGTSGGNIVWDWHAWDHLVQDFDPTKANFGVVADNPGLIDINYEIFLSGPDWLHTNGIDYNEALDQIALSTLTYSEIWVIDHSTTIEQAAGHTGGNSGMGGDLLYRWGNPEAYDRGGAADQKLFNQHDARWVEPGHPGEGNLTAFSNRAHLAPGAPPGPFSAVVEFAPPIDGNGHYTLLPGAAYGPEEPTWTYVADPPTDLYAPIMSGAQRLPNGNTLICDGPLGTFLEVTEEGQTAWLYVNPVSGAGPVPQGESSPGAVFKITRYPPDHPGLDGKELTPGDPIEIYADLYPVPDGDGASEPMTCQRVTPGGDQIRMFWDPVFCGGSTDYNFIFGNLSEVADYTLQSAECAIGSVGVYSWSGVPAGDLYFLIVGVHECPNFESSWGTNSLGEERNGTTPSHLCGVTTKITTGLCQ